MTHQHLYICHVAPRYAPSVGGVEVHVAQLARRAAALGHRVEVLTQESDSRLPRTERLDGVMVRRFPLLAPSQNFALAPGLWRYLRRHANRFDLIHAHSYHALPALAAALTSNRPLVFTPYYHGTGHSPLRRFLHIPYRHLGAAIFRRASQILCLSEAEAALARRHFPESANRLVVVPTGIEVEAIAAATPFPTQHKVILSVGRLEAYKQVCRLVEALPYLDACYVLIVVGDGPERQALEATAGRLGVSGRVTFRGRVSDDEMRRWYRTATVYGALSLHESFGITVWEALSGGARVVATDIPAHREVALLQGPGTVSLAPVDASPVMVARAIRAMASERRETSFPTGALSWTEVAERTLTIYRTVARATV